MEICSQLVFTQRHTFFIPIFSLCFRWVCHVDDDVYVNVKELIRILNIFKDSQPVYLDVQGPLLKHQEQC